MSRIRSTLIVSFGIFANLGCTTKVIVLKTTPAARVDMLSAGNLDDPGKELGKTPLKIELDQIAGKVLRLSQDGKIPVYWVVAEAAGATTEASIKLADATTGAVSVAGATVASKDSSNLNRVLRLVLAAYQELSREQYQAARDLAQQAGRIDPSIAAPEVLRGLAFYKEGNTEEAKTAFLKAKALDPEDSNIDELIKAVP